MVNPTSSWLDTEGIASEQVSTTLYKMLENKIKCSLQEAVGHPPSFPHSSPQNVDIKSVIMFFLFSQSHDQVQNMILPPNEFFFSE